MIWLVMPGSVGTTPIAYAFSSSLAPSQQPLSLVTARRDSFDVGGGGALGSGTGSTAGEIASWVSRHYTSRVVECATVDDLTAPAS